MLDPNTQALPRDPGSYVLWLHLSQPEDLLVGRLGYFTLPGGDYIYLGSARGPGGLRARLGRHLGGDRSQRSGKPHWHIDHLRAVAQVHGFGYSLEGTINLPAECAWSQKLTTLPGASILIRGFGASDCRSGCAAHLVYFPVFDLKTISTQETSFRHTRFTVHN